MSVVHTWTWAVAQAYRYTTIGERGYWVFCDVICRVNKVLWVASCVCCCEGSALTSNHTVKSTMSVVYTTGGCHMLEILNGLVWADRLSWKTQLLDGCQFNQGMHDSPRVTAILLQTSRTTIHTRIQWIFWTLFDSLEARILSLDCKLRSIIAERVSVRQLLRVVFSQYAYIRTCRHA